MGSGLLAQGLQGGTPRGHRIAVQMQRARASAAWGVLGRYGKEPSFSLPQPKRAGVPASDRRIPGGAYARLTPKFAYVCPSSARAQPYLDPVCRAARGKGKDMNARHNRWSARCNASREFIGWDCQQIALIDIIHRHSDIDLFAEAPNPSTASPANRRDIIASAMAASRPNAAGQFDVLTLAIL